MDIKSFNAYIGLNDIETKQLKLTSKYSSTTQTRITPSKITEVRSKDIIVIDNYTQAKFLMYNSKPQDPLYITNTDFHEGHQDHVYFIPSNEGLINFAMAIKRFLDYAAYNSDKNFYVLSIGCGLVGYNPLLVAPLLSKAVGLPNVMLPRVFWEYFWMTNETCPNDFIPSKCWMEYEQKL